MSPERAIIGTTPAIFVPREDHALEIRAGQDYFLIQLCGAQASFRGTIWERVKRLLVISQVKLNVSSPSSDPVRALQKTREVRKNTTTQLGLSPNLVDLVPAIMPGISISVEFLIDKEDRLAMLAGLINDDSFLAVASLAPGAGAIAKTVGGLAQKVVNSFVPAQEREPILQFGGDFNIVDGTLRDGFYVILGTRDEDVGLPTVLTGLKVSGGQVVADKLSISNLSYVIFDVRRVAARTREMNSGAAWDLKLREAEALVQDSFFDDTLSYTDRREVWEKCRGLLREAQIMIRTDVNYHRWESDRIIAEAYKQCNSIINSSATQERTSHVSENKLLMTSEDQVLFGGVSGAEFDSSLRHYDQDVVASRKLLRQAGVLVGA